MEIRICDVYTQEIQIFKIRFHLMSFSDKSNGLLLYSLLMSNKRVAKIICKCATCRGPDTINLRRKVHCET